MTRKEPVFANEPLGIIEDIAALVRTLSGKEPFRSASGPDAMLALASHLDEMVAGYRTNENQPRAVRVAVRARRSR